MMNDQGGGTGMQPNPQASWDQGPSGSSGLQSQKSNDEGDVHHDEDWGEVIDARPILPKAAFFMGDLRDGLPMVRTK